MLKGDQKMPPPPMPLWHEDCAGQKAVGKKQTQEEHSALQLFAGKEGIRFPCDAPWLRREENSSLYPRGGEGATGVCLSTTFLTHPACHAFLQQTSFPRFSFASSLLQNLRPVVKWYASVSPSPPNVTVSLGLYFFSRKPSGRVKIAASNNIDVPFLR